MSVEKLIKTLFWLLNIPLGKWFGVGVYLHFTLTILFVTLLCFDISNVLIMLGLFLIVLLHEFGHVFGGRKVGLKANRIDLTIIGGMAWFEDTIDPKKEFIMTVCGPLVNVALILPLYALGLCFPFFWRLSYINVLLLIFNILPIFPMDGGRILRSGLAHWMKDYLRATQISCRISFCMCIAMIVFGIMTVNFFLGAIAVWMLVNSGKELQEVEQKIQNHRRDNPQEELSESADILSGMQKRVTKFRRRHKDFD